MGLRKAMPYILKVMKEVLKYIQNAGAYEDDIIIGSTGGQRRKSYKTIRRI